MDNTLAALIFPQNALVHFFYTEIICLKDVPIGICNGDKVSFSEVATESLNHIFSTNFFLQRLRQTFFFKANSLYPIMRSENSLNTFYKTWLNRALSESNKM
jgi:hypothetical protein